MAKIEEINYIGTGSGNVSGEGSSSVNEKETYSVYFKGLILREETVKFSEMISGGVLVVGIGVVICDSMKNMILELSLSKPMAIKNVGTETFALEAKLEALIQGLNAAKQLGIKKLYFFCKGHKLYNYLRDENADENDEEELKKETGKGSQMNPTIRRFRYLLSQFEKCSPFLATKDDGGGYGRHASKLAREAKFSQVSCPEVSQVTIPVKILKERCGICLEDIDVAKMFSVYNCHHKCCSSCVKKHVEVKLRQGTLPKCPHEGCASDVEIDGCKNVLNPELVELMNERLKEAKIPVVERVYCPYPRCSNLMSKTEVLNYSKRRSPTKAEQTGYRKCLKCHGRFCVNCKVPWHSKMTCSDYKKLHPYSCVEDEMLNLLAKRNSWRQCIKCNQMIELDVGCYHIICRCGYQFCYTCGSEWKKEKASCSCPLWDEHRIIY